MTFILATVGIVLCRATQTNAQTQTPLHVIVLPFEITAAAYYAQDLRLFSRAGLDVKIQSLANGGAVTAAVISGAADIGSSNPISLEIAYEKGFPVTILAGAAYQDAKSPTNGLLSVATNSPIHSAKDLNGKTIAVSGLGNTADLGVRNWIDKNGGDSTTVKLVEVPISTMTAALLAGRVDAAELDASNFDAAPKTRIRLLASTFDSLGPRWLQSVWFTSKDFATRHPDVAMKFIAAIREASAWANAHPRDAIRVFAKYSKYSLAALAASVRPELATQAVVPAQLQPTIDVALKYGVLKKGFPASELINALNDER